MANEKRTITLGGVVYHYEKHIQHDPPAQKKNVSGSLQSPSLRAEKPQSWVTLVNVVSIDGEAVDPPRTIEVEVKAPMRTSRIVQD